MAAQPTHGAHRINNLGLALRRNRDDNMSIRAPTQRGSRCSVSSILTTLAGPCRVSQSGRSRWRRSRDDERSGALWMMHGWSRIRLSVPLLLGYLSALDKLKCIGAEPNGRSARLVSDASASLAGFYKLLRTLGLALWLFEEEDQDTVRSRIRELESELSQRLLTYFKDSENSDNYLVRGIVIVTNLDGQWNVQFPQYEVARNTEQVGEQAILNIPSAFHLFVYGRDWSGAHEIVKARKDAFTTPGLMGWRAVTLANVTPAEAMTHFDKAADAFSADTQPDSEELTRRGGYWSGANQQLWAKYFRARARLIESIRHPARVRELLGQAVDALVGTEAG
jgi:hypothetical protein